MVDPTDQVTLPASVERMLATICEQHSVSPPDIGARRELALLGEEASLDILRRISNSTQIRTFSGFIFYMVKMARAGSFSPPPSRPSPSGSSSPFSSTSPGGVRQQTPRAVSLWGGTTSARLPSSFSSALAELEFKKAFLLLSYAGKRRLEDVIQVDDIRNFKNSSKARFESDAWQKIGRHCIDEKDRRKNFDLDHQGAFLYHCLVDSNGTYSFKGPYYDYRRTHLQKVFGDDNVLMVKFCEETSNRNCSAISSCRASYMKIAEEGIFVGLRRYYFFVFKDGGKEEKKKDPTSSGVKCYFVRMESNSLLDLKKQYPLVCKHIQEARCRFMHAHTVNSVVKYMKRFSLILSKTIKLDVDFASVVIQTIGDEPCKDENGCAVHDEDGKLLVHTDGTGFISEDLALKCPRNIYKGNQSRGDVKETLGLAEPVQILGQAKSHMEEPPLLMQVRLFHNGRAVKGTLLVNKKLPSGTIQIRPSMIKVEQDQELKIPSANSLELVSTSCRPRKGFLSRSLIALLNYGGVPKEYFMELLKNALEDARNIHSNKRAALRVAFNYGEMDDCLAARMILCGIPLEEPFLHRHLSVLAKQEKKGLKGGRLPIDECFNVMGTADPTGILKRDEVCVILDNGQISGKVLVYRHPGLHFGDIHVLTATYVKELEAFVGNSKYGIFFPTKGSRSLADEMAGGDFDGDMYWVSRNPELLHYFKPSDPWKCSYSAKSTCLRKPTDFPPEELERELFQQFLSIRFQPSHTVGIASDSWSHFMDRLLVLGDQCEEEKECLKKKMLQLIDIYYDALDAPKTGIKVEIPNELKALQFPHYMQKPTGYASISILGLIYDQVDLLQNEDFPSTEVWKLPYFDVEVPPICMDRWRILYPQYRSDMSDALKNKPNSFKSPEKNQSAKCEPADEVIQKYKKEIYFAPEFELTKRNEEEIFNDALAIYKVTYDYARKMDDVAKCGFAWKVAGRALCRYYLKKMNDEFSSSESVLRELFNLP